MILTTMPLATPSHALVYQLRSPEIWFPGQVGQIEMTPLFASIIPEQNPLLH